MAESELNILVRVRDEASELLEKIGVTTEKLIKAGLEPLEKIAPTIARGLEEMVSSMGPVGLGIAAIGGAAVGATAALFELAHSTAEYGHELEIAHLKTGVSIESLEGLKVAAAEVGQSLDSITLSFRFLDRNLQAAADGGDRQAEAFHKIGLSVNALLAESPDKRFTDIATALSKMEDTSARNAIGVQLLGRSFLNLIPIIEQVGRGGLDPFIQKAKDFGIALTEEDVKASAKMVATLADLKLALEGTGYALGAQLLEPMTALAHGFVEAAKAIVQFEKDTGGLSAVVNAITFSMTVLSQTVNGIAAAYKAAKEARDEFSVIAGGDQDFDKLHKENDALKELEHGYDEAERNRSKRDASHKEADDEELARRDKIGQKILDLTNAAKAAEDAQTVAELKSSGDRVAAAQAEYQAKINLIEDEKEKKYDAIKALEGNDLVDAGVQIEREAAAKIGEAYVALKDQKIAAEEAYVNAVAHADEQILASESKLLQTRQQLAQTKVSAGASIYDAELSALDKVTQAQAKADEAHKKAQGDDAGAEKVASDARLAHLQIQMELEIAQNTAKIKGLQIELEFQKQIDEIEERRLQRQIVAAQKQLELTTDKDKRIELEAKIADLQDQILEKKITEEAAQTRINAAITVARTEMEAMVTATNAEVDAEKTAASAAQQLAGSVTQAAGAAQTLATGVASIAGSYGGGGGSPRGTGQGPLGSASNPFTTEALSRSGRSGLGGVQFGGVQQVAWGGSTTPSNAQGIPYSSNLFAVSDMMKKFQQDIYAIEDKYNGMAAYRAAGGSYSLYNGTATANAIPRGGDQTSAGSIDRSMDVYIPQGKLIEPFGSDSSYNIGYGDMYSGVGAAVNLGASSFSNVEPPRYAEGGFVDQTGLAVVHKGEYVVPAMQAQGLRSGGDIMGSMSGFTERGGGGGGRDRIIAANTTVNISMPESAGIPNQGYLQDLSATMGATIADAQSRGRLVG